MPFERKSATKLSYLLTGISWFFLHPQPVATKTSFWLDLDFSSLRVWKYRRHCHFFPIPNSRAQSEKKDNITILIMSSLLERDLFEFYGFFVCTIKLNGIRWNGKWRKIVFDRWMMLWYINGRALYGMTRDRLYMKSAKMVFINLSENREKPVEIGNCTG